MDVIIKVIIKILAVPGTVLWTNTGICWSLLEVTADHHGDHRCLRSPHPLQLFSHPLVSLVSCPLSYWWYQMALQHLSLQPCPLTPPPQQPGLTSAVCIWSPTRSLLLHSVTPIWTLGLFLWTHSRGSCMLSQLPGFGVHVCCTRQRPTPCW